MRLIDADALKESLKELKADGNNRRYVQGLQDAIDDYFPQIIDDEPTIDAEQVKHARWIFKEMDELVPTGKLGVAEGHHIHLSSGETFDPDKMGILVLKKHRKVIKPFCSNCGDYGDDASDATPFCPNCGAKMDGDTNNET